MSTRTLRTLLTVGLLVATACGSRDAASPTATSPAATGELESTTPASVGITAVGRFPAFPTETLSDQTAGALQRVLDASVDDGTFVGVTAAVVVGDRGSWAGAAGSWDDEPITIESRHPTHSAGKTFVAAEILRLAEDDRLNLDDQAARHLPPELGFFDANGATIREVLAMRSGIPDLNEDAGYYPAEQAATPRDVFTALAKPSISPGTVTRYASTNFVLLGTIIEHTTDLPLADALRAGVLVGPGLDGIVYTVADAMASDGWGVETTAASLARWGYALYGGSVLAEASLREMLDFQGQWYGLGVMDFSDEYDVFAVGHQGLSSVTTCCSAIILLALPDEATVIAVQADTHGTPSTNTQVDRLAGALQDTIRE